MKKIAAILVFLSLLNTAYSQRGYEILKADIETAKQQDRSPQQPVSLFSSQPANKSAASYSKTTEKWRNSKVGEKWKKYPIKTLKNKELSALSEKRPYVLNLKVPVEGLGKLKAAHQEVELELVQFSVFSENFTQTLMPSGEVQTLEDLDHGITYRGIIKELDNSMAMVHIMDDELSIIMSSPEIGNIAVEKLKGTENEYLIYEDKELFEEKPFTCDTEDSSYKDFDFNLPANKSVQSAVDGCFGIHFDVSNAIYTERGSGTSAYIQAIFSGVATLFYNEGINITLVSTKIWTSPEPFSAFLDSYSAYVGDNPVDATFSHFLLGFSAGGVAFTGATCAGGPNSEFSVGISNTGTDDFNPFPAFSYPVYIVSHELGHNFGSQHTHDCIWNGNNTAIDGCGPNSGSCAGQDIPPPDQGTVMSFCETSGINLSLGFGPQPGDRIRSYASQITCNSYDCGNINTDCTVSPGTISGGGTACNSGGSITGSPASGPPTIQYTWQRRLKCNNVYGAWTTNSNTAASHSFGPFTAQAQQWRRGAKSTQCGGDWVYSNVLTFTNTCPPSSCIDCTVSAGTISGGGTACNSGGAMTGTAASGPGTIQYIWQRRLKCNNVYGAWSTSQNNTLPFLSVGPFTGQAQQWRRGAKSTQCGGDWVYSNVLTFTNTCPPSSCIDCTVSAGTISGGGTACNSGGAMTGTAASGPGTIQYIWQRRLKCNNVYGAWSTSQNNTLPFLSVGPFTGQAQQWRRGAKSTQCGGDWVYSNVLTFTNTCPPSSCIDCTVSAGTISGGGTACNSGGTFSHTPASGPGTIQYSWQRRLKCNNVYSAWSTTLDTAPSFSIGPFTGQAQQWRRGAKSTQCGGDWVYSNVLTFTNTCPPSSCIDCTVSAGTISGGGTACNSGGTFSHTPASGPGTIQYSWQRRLKCNNVYSAWSTTLDTAPSFSIGPFTGQAQQWRRGAKSTQCGGDWVYSNVVTFTNTCPPTSCIDCTVSPGTITGGGTVCGSGGSMAGTSASGPATIQYIWQRRLKCNDVYSAWSNSRNTGANLTIGSFQGQAQQWRRGAKSTQCGGDWVYSNVLTFTNTCPPSSCIDCTVSAGTISGGGTACNSGGAMTGTAASGPGTIQYIWQRRLKCNNVYGAWSTSQNNTLPFLSVGPFTGQAQQWRRGAKSTQCGGDWVYSNVLTFTNTCPPTSCIDCTVSPGTITGGGTACNSGGFMNGSPASGPGTIQYSWQRRLKCNNVYSAWSTTFDTAPSFSIGPFTGQAQQWRRGAKSTQCGGDWVYSNVLTFTNTCPPTSCIDCTVSPGTITGGGTACNSGGFMTGSPASGPATIQYSWQRRLKCNNVYSAWTTSLDTAPSFSIGPFTGQAQQWRRGAKSTQCGGDWVYSNVLTFTNTCPPSSCIDCTVSAGSISGGGTACNSGGAMNGAPASGPATIQYIWQRRLKCNDVYSAWSNSSNTGANFANLTVGSFQGQAQQWRRGAKSTQCGGDWVYSNVLTFTNTCPPSSCIDCTVSAGSISGGGTACNSGGAMTGAPASGPGTIQYIWQRRLKCNDVYSAWSNSSNTGANFANLTVGSFQGQAQQWRRGAKSTQCGGDWVYSNVLTFTNTCPPSSCIDCTVSAGSISGGGTACNSGGAMTGAPASGPGTIQYIWQRRLKCNDVYSAWSNSSNTGANFANLTVGSFTGQAQQWRRGAKSTQCGGDWVYSNALTFTNTCPPSSCIDCTVSAGSISGGGTACNSGGAMTGAPASGPGTIQYIWQRRLKCNDVYSAWSNSSNTGANFANLTIGSFQGQAQQWRRGAKSTQCGGDWVYSNVLTFTNTCPPSSCTDPCFNLGGDSDGDGVCNASDICPGGDDNLDTDGDGTPDFCDNCNFALGSSCNDNNACTTNDVYDVNCNCAGTFADADGDGVCDANDICPGGDDNIDTDGDGTPDFCDNSTSSGCNDCSTVINNFPHTEDFESGLSVCQLSSDDFDWTVFSGSTSSSGTGPSAAYEGSRYFYMESSSPNNPSKTAGFQGACYDLSSASGASIDFWYHMYGATMGRLTLEISKDNGVSWTTAWTLAGNQGNSWSNVNIDLSAYTGNVITYRFVGATSTSFTSDFALDQITVDSGSSACRVGASCNDNNVCTTNDVYDSNCNCAGTFADADGDGVCDANDICPGGNDNIDTDGDGTPDFCDNGTSAGCNDCSTVINNFPHTEDFESSLSICQLSSDDFDWTVFSGSTSSSGTGPSAAYEGSRYFYMESSSPNNPSKTAGFQGACYDLRSASGASIDFWYHMYGATMGRLTLEISTDNGVSWTTAWTLAGDQGNSWSNVNIDLSAYTGNVITYRFVGATSTNFTSDFALDQITVDTGNSACRVGASCNDNNVCTTNDVYDSNCNCAGTFADADGDGVCDANDICPGGNDNIDTDGDGTPDFCDNGTSSGCNDCSTVINNFPHTEDFESSLSICQLSSDDFDWTVFSGSTSSSGTGPSAAYEGSRYFYMESSSPNNPSKTAGFQGACYDLSSASGASIDFWYHMYGATMGRLTLEISKDNGVSWTTAWTLAGDQGNSWSNVNIDLSAYTGNVITYRFVGATSTNFTSDFALDQITVDTGSSACTVGGSCNDNNVCTTNDVYDSNCNCAGTFADADGDGVCDANDICPGGNDNIDTDGDGTPDFCDNGTSSGCNDCSTVINNFPHTEDFESGLSVCQLSSDDFDWTVFSGSTSSSGTGPSAAYEGSRYFYMESSSPNNPSKTAGFQGACYDLRSASGASIDFWYHMYGANMGSLKLEISDDMGASWNTVWQMSQDQGNNWYNVNVDISSFTGNIMTYRFTGTTGNGFKSDIALDNISVVKAGSCLPGGNCDDNDPCTTGETYDSSCNCTGGQVVDQDNDGYCLAEDADDSDPCVPDSSNAGCLSSVGCSTYDLNDFEGSLGIWNDGGSDAGLSNNSAYSGSKSMFLRDNSGFPSSIYTDDLAMASYDEIVVSFTYVTNSMESGEDFLLEFSNDSGSSFETIQSWVSGIDFQNFQRQFVTVSITGKTFNDQVVLRLRCDASNNADYVFLDDVQIEGCNGIGDASQGVIKRTREITEEDKSKLFVFPNPLIRDLNVRFVRTEVTKDLPVHIEILTSFGQKLIDVTETEIKEFYTVNTSQLASGQMYICKLTTTEGKIYFQRFMKI